MEEHGNMNIVTHSNRRRKIRSAEFVAGLALAVKVAEGVVKLVPSQGVWHLEPIALILAYLSWALLLVSVLLWLRTSAQQLEKVDEIARQLATANRESALRDRVARYASGGVWVASLLDLRRRFDGHVHCHAGGVTLSHLLLDVFTNAAKEFHDLTSGQQEKLTLREYHVVDSFLLNLMKALPTGSIWLGISRLQSPEAWQRKSSHADFHDFQRLVESRTKARDIAFFRLWCFEDDNHFREMEPILARQAQAKLNLRHITGKSMPEDISIIWVPTSQVTHVNEIKDVNDPIAEIKERTFDFQPLCGINFETRGGRELDEMTLYSPKEGVFRELCINFQNSWQKGNNFIPAEQKDTETGKKPPTIEMLS
jgi:hypothetical protein